MRILFLFIQLVFIFFAYASETVNSERKISKSRAVDGKQKISKSKAANGMQKISKGKKTKGNRVVSQVKAANSEKTVVEIAGEFVIKNKYRVHFVLNERNGEHYLTFSVEGGSCDYHVRRLKAPQQIKGYKGIIFSNKTPDYDFKIPDRKINNLFNSFELADLVYIVNKEGKITGDITLSSLTETYRSEIHSQ